MRKLRFKFIFEFFAEYRFASGTGSGWIATLNHKIFNQSMKMRPFIITVPAMLNKIIARFRRLIAE